LTKELYIFSGLGADERAFQRLDFSGFSTTFINWVIPQDTDTIEHYVTRLLDQITTTKPTLIGLSFGGLGGIPSPLDSFVVAESSVLRINFCAENPAHRQSAKR
jgi:hypothetical protein